MQATVKDTVYRFLRSKGPVGRSVIERYVQAQYSRDTDDEVGQALSDLIDEKNVDCRMVPGGVAYGLSKRRRR